MGLRDIVREKLGLGDSGDPLLDSPGGDTAIASIMVLVANSDGGISLDEGLRIREFLMQRFGLDSHDAQALIGRVADRYASGVDDQARVIATLRNELTAAGKEDLMLVILEVIAADQEKDVKEVELLARLIEELQIPDKTMNRAYERYFESRRSRQT
jgi:uncharacterized tellurite resistance protein B-like protein